MKIFACGVVIYVVSSLLAALSSSATMLISVPALQGVGGAMIAGTGVAMLTSVFPVGERGKALGINVAATYAGLSFGPAIGGVLTQHFGWRSIFLINVPLGLVVIAVVLWKLKGEWAEAKGEKFDFGGSIIYSLALIAVMYGFSLLPAVSGRWLILMGALGLLAFAKWGMKARSPVLDMNLFLNETTALGFVVGSLLLFGLGFALFSSLLLVSAAYSHRLPEGRFGESVWCTAKLL